MKKYILGLSAVVALAAAPGDGRATFILSLTPSADAAHLQVGQSVTFDVTLSGIDPGNSNTYLSFLAATVGYDNSLLSPNPMVTPGPIIPDTSGFVIDTGFSNAADAFYDGFFIASTPISQNGTFFSFQVTALQAGSGTLSFTAAAATLANDPTQNDQVTPDTVNLNFNVEANGSPAAAPEPSTFVLMLSVLLCGSIHLGLRGLAHRVRLGKPKSIGVAG